MLGFFGTIWGQLLVQAAVGAASAGVQYVTGHDFGSANGIVQGVAGVGSELLAVFGGGKAPLSAVAQTTK